MRLSLSIPSCTLPGAHRDGISDRDKRRICEDDSLCHLRCRATAGQSVDHRNTDGINLHIRTLSLLVFSVDIVACWGSGVQNWRMSVCKIGTGPERQLAVGGGDRDGWADGW